MYIRNKRRRGNSGDKLGPVNKNLKFCENFTGGYCPVKKGFIPRSWCFLRCDITKEYPSLLEQGVSFSIALAKHVASGYKNRSPELIVKLKIICQACLYYVADGKPKFQKEGPQCRECGCGLTLKTAWSTSYCRKGYWDETLREVKW